MKAALYVRVSTDDQSIEGQLHDLKGLASARGWEPVIYRDEGRTGTNTDRDGYRDMMKAAKQGKVGVVAVWKLDRLGRSVLQLVGDMEQLKAWGVDLVSVRDDIDTTTPMGRAMFGIIAVFAQLERDNISERTRAAYRAKKANAENIGKKVRWGRPAAKIPTEVIGMVMNGTKSEREIAEACGVSRHVVKKARALVGNGGA